MPHWNGTSRAYRLPKRWHRIREYVLARDGYRCQIQLDGCSVTATEVDHIDGSDDHSELNLRAACAWCNGRVNIASRPLRRQQRRPAERHPGVKG